MAVCLADAAAGVAAALPLPLAPPEAGAVAAAPLEGAVWPACPWALAKNAWHRASMSHASTLAASSVRSWDWWRGRSYVSEMRAHCGAGQRSARRDRSATGTEAPDQLRGMPSIIRVPPRCDHRSQFLLVCSSHGFQLRSGRAVSASALRRSGTHNHARRPSTGLLGPGAQPSAALGVVSAEFGRRIRASPPGRSSSRPDRTQCACAAAPAHWARRSTFSAPSQGGWECQHRLTHIRCIPCRRRSSGTEFSVDCIIKLIKL